jgi:hypothetical protein
VAQKLAWLLWDAIMLTSQARVPGELGCCQSKGSLEPDWRTRARLITAPSLCPAVLMHGGQSHVALP